jgi:uncharacterized protein YrzB (UPF0473 family)
MSANGEERTDIVILVDEEGNEHDFALVDRFQVELKEYAVLVPVTYTEDEQEGDELDFEDEAYIFRIELDGEEETLLEVEDESEWNQVAAVWEERMETLELEDDDDLF